MKLERFLRWLEHQHVSVVVHSPSPSLWELIAIGVVLITILAGTGPVLRWAINRD